MLRNNTKQTTQLFQSVKKKLNSRGWGNGGKICQEKRQTGSENSTHTGGRDLPCSLRTDEKILKVGKFRAVFKILMFCFCGDRGEKLKSNGPGRVVLKEGRFQKPHPILPKKGR